VDPQTDAHTQNIERLWGSSKCRNKKHRGTARQHLDNYLVELMWCQKHESPFIGILNCMFEHFPPRANY
jgi:hypothetical protein